LTSDAIASRMGIEYEGVRKHRQHIKAKVGVSELPELEERREEWDTSP
jgi:DNA-binding CsgD family transcriptional regulator